MGFGGILAIMLILGLLAVVVFGMAVPFSPTYLNITYLFQKVYDLFSPLYQGTTYVNADGSTGLIQTWETIKFVSSFITVLLAGLCFYLFLRLLEMEKEHEDHVYHATDHPRVVHVDEPHLDEPKPGERRWSMVLQYMKGGRPEDWKLAIIEADALLDDMTIGAGMHGETLGERLKNSDKGMFRTLDYAWEAHNTRNKIAHEGSHFDLTEREAYRIIALYEEVFREFKYI